ncbi:MAG TPA: POTRA domain-containing protein, partial [Gemmatimonadaceae bacterium]|nr:POTRA domain-containing protein [Gemmatimonadaceae bacterium]
MSGRLGFGAGVLLALLAPAVARGQDPSCEAGAPEVRALEFEGNATFPDRELALRVSTTPSSLARRILRVFGARRCLDREELALDIARLQVFYRRRGFFETRVDTLVTQAGGDAVRVRFRVAEGAPVLMDSVVVQGADSLAPEARRAVLGAIRLAPGQRFDQDRIRETSDSIRARLRDRGFPRADVALETNVEYAARRARVGFTVVPGQLAHLGRVEVRVEPIEGRSQQIAEPVVRRIAGLREGSLYRESELAAAHRNLYGTSAYRHVDVRTAIDSAHPLGDSLRVLIDLREDLTRQLDTEAGWGTLDCFRARAQYVDRNFLSGARRLELTSQVSKIGFGYPLDQAKSLCGRALRRDDFSDTLHYFVGATLRQPAFRGTRFTPAFSLYRERRGEYLAFLRSTLIGGEA